MASKSPGITRRTWEIGGSSLSTTGKSSMNVVRIAPPPGQGEVVDRAGRGNAQEGDKAVHRPIVESRDGLTDPRSSPGTRRGRMWGLPRARSPDPRRGVHRSTGP